MRVSLRTAAEPLATHHGQCRVPAPVLERDNHTSSLWCSLSPVNRQHGFLYVLPVGRVVIGRSMRTGSSRGCPRVPWHLAGGVPSAASADSQVRDGGGSVAMHRLSGAQGSATEPAPAAPMRMFCRCPAPSRLRLRGDRAWSRDMCFIAPQWRGYGDEPAAPMSSVEAPTDSNRSTMKWWHVNTSTWWVSARRAKASAA